MYPWAANKQKLDISIAACRATYTGPNPGPSTEDIKAEYIRRGGLLIEVKSDSPVDNTPVETSRDVAPIVETPEASVEAPKPKRTRKSKTE